MKTIKTAKSKTEAPVATHEPQTTKATTARSAVALITASSHEITSELIAARAYTIWEQNGRPQGHDMDNWFLAENQLKQEVKSLRA